MIRRAQYIGSHGHGSNAGRNSPAHRGHSQAVDPRERARRSGFRRLGWLPPIFAEADILGFGPSDSDFR